MTDLRQQKYLKQKAYHWGWVAEYLCILILIVKGYHLICRRFKCKVGEIDLIMQKNNMICFIEVKARKSRGAALSALSYKQQKRITRAAEWYLAQNYQKIQNNTCRFDLMAVEPWHWPTHVRDAWQMEHMK